MNYLDGNPKLGRTIFDQMDTRTEHKSIALINNS